jgi:alkylation response protein AidB-like acyl-CoA dehydrogenase
VDFEFTEEQKMLKKNAREFMEKEIIPQADEYDRKYNPLPKELLTELYKKLAPLGYITGLVPEEYGGGGLDYISYGILVEELARAYCSLALSVTAHQLTGPLALYIEGSEEQKARYLRPTMSGEIICAFGATEPEVGSAVRDIKTTAVLDGAKYVINGTKTWITNGTVAGLVMLVAVANDSKGNKGITRFWVEREHSKFETRELPKLGICSCSAAELIFQHCPVPKENLISEVGKGYAGMVEMIFPTFRASMAMLGVGLSQAALDAAIKYARERKQFGRPIAKFQLVQEMIADMTIEAEAARLLVFQAYNSLQKGADSVKRCAMAKVFAHEVAFRVTSKAIEIHGAYGVSEEYSIERYFRDARTLIFLDGTSEIQKLIVGREVLGMSAFV